LFPVFALQQLLLAFGWAALLDGIEDCVADAFNFSLVHYRFGFLLALTVLPLFRLLLIFIFFSSLFLFEMDDFINVDVGLLDG
jgi:uncharacterized membrane protein HdeD (DUF308 family)